MATLWATQVMNLIVCPQARYLLCPVLIASHGYECRAPIHSRRDQTDRISLRGEESPADAFWHRLVFYGVVREPFDTQDVVGDGGQRGIPYEVVKF